MNHRIIVCKCCGKTGPSGAHGWRKTCYNRWRHHGRPLGGPPRPMTRSERAAASRGPWKSRIERVDDFVLVLKTRPADGVREAVAQAAAAVGRCERTGWRYVTSLREQGVPLRDLLHQGVPR